MTSIIDRSDLPRLLAQYGGLSPLTAAAMDADGCQSVAGVADYLDQLAANSRAKADRRADRGSVFADQERATAEHRQQSADALRSLPDMRYHVVSAIFGTLGCCGICGHEWPEDARQGYWLGEAQS